MVSSWTDLENESIPFWGLYTKNMSGIRLKMRRNPFQKYNLGLSYYLNGSSFESYCPEDILNNNAVYFYPTLPFLRKVEYTDDEKLIFPEPISMLKQNSNGGFDLIGNFNDLNRYKRDSWSFQSEWRYSLLFFPHNEKGSVSLNLSANSDDMPFWYCDLKITDEAFKDIEIMTGPKMQFGDKILLESLVRQYCPNARIVESKLKIN